ncbi:mycofactocin biosynthesis chaperone MftB [Amycolatopsis lexingtonensis]|uniref:mycofactocin biosynthesis chaperone MftB n=1 Tax=Amycolatopsis lexingtonensis TaxID=218822 RepID=UPI003F70C612
MTDASTVDLDAPYRVNPREPFEALAHHCERRDGCLLGAPDVVRFVRELAMHATARDALDAAELGETSRARVVAALEHLAATGVIVAVP